MESCNSSLDHGDWECISDEHLDDLISLSTFESSSSPLLDTIDFQSYREALQFNIRHGEDGHIRANMTKGSTLLPTNPSSCIGHNSQDHDVEEEDDYELFKFLQTVKRRKARQTRRKSKDRYADKKSHANFHSMKRCCVRSQQVIDDENLYVPHATHNSHTWWDCGIGDNDLRMAKPRWKI